jgi:hypothetical protein
VLLPCRIVAGVCKELKPIGGEVEIAISKDGIVFTGPLLAVCLTHKLRSAKGPPPHQHQRCANGIRQFYVSLTEFFAVSRQVLRALRDTLRRSCCSAFQVPLSEVRATLTSINLSFPTANSARYARCLKRRVCLCRSASRRHSACSSSSRAWVC